jgi:hypothetical protein
MRLPLQRDEQEEGREHDISPGPKHNVLPAQDANEFRPQLTYCSPNDGGASGSIYDNGLSAGIIRPDICFSGKAGPTLICGGLEKHDSLASMNVRVG